MLYLLFYSCFFLFFSVNCSWILLLALLCEEFVFVYVVDTHQSEPKSLTRRHAKQSARGTCACEDAHACV